MKSFGTLACSAVTAQTWAVIARASGPEILSTPKSLGKKIDIVPFESIFTFDSEHLKISIINYPCRRYDPNFLRAIVSRSSSELTGLKSGE
jgi:hypothetical protein